VRAYPGPPHDAEIVLPEATPAALAARVPWLAALLPAVLGVVLALVMHSPQYLLFALLSPVLMVSTTLSDRWSGRRRSRQQEDDRHAAAAAADTAVGARVAAERAAARWRWPDPTTVARIAAVPTVRLWERTIRDGLPLRVGLGTVPSSVRVRDAAGSRAAAELSPHPVRVDLAGGPLGLIAPAGRGVRCARWLVAQLAALYSPAEVEVCVLVGDGCTERWEWVRWLPHVRGRVATTPAATRRLVDELSAERDRRRDGAHRGPQPWLVLIVDVGAGAGQLPGLAGLGFDRVTHRITAVCVADS
jgi:S-DNA-T family DNA segregation ATPase FtsK/SpoIIIE